MKEGFRQSMAWLHTWTGLVVGWVLFFVFITGTLGYVQGHISRWMQPELPLQTATEPVSVSRAEGIERALQHLQKVAGSASRWSIIFPITPRNSWFVSWQELLSDGKGTRAIGHDIIDIRTGLSIGEQPVETRHTAGGRTLYRMHYELRYIPYPTAIKIVGICTMLMLLAIITGVITHKKIFKDFFTFRPNKGQRSWLDAHNIISVMALPFFLMITYSGLVFFKTEYMPGIPAFIHASDKQQSTAPPPHTRELQRIESPKISLEHIAERTKVYWPNKPLHAMTLLHYKGEGPIVIVTGFGLHQSQKLVFSAEDGSLIETSPPPGSPTNEFESILLTLHEGWFAGWWLRWLYLLSGFLGCIMIATGLILWTVKRRIRHLKSSSTSLFDRYGLHLVEILNIGTLVGLPVAIALYFWANRLLPVTINNRPEWEIDCMFISWGWLFLYAALRPLKKAWIEICWMAAAAFGLLPLLNMLTTDRHLGVTLMAGDWILAGIDLSMFVVGAAFAYIAVKIRRHWLKLEINTRCLSKET